MAAMSKAKKRTIALLILTGSGGIVFGSHILRRNIKQFQKEQNDLYEHSLLSRAKSTSKSSNANSKVAVDVKFAKRLMKILSICVPHIYSKEAFYILVQTGLLYSRTLLSDSISSLEGEIAQALISKNWHEFANYLVAFALITFPAATVNSGLKAMRTAISLSFQNVLTKRLHQSYLTKRVYYLASTLKGLSNPDQRITEDVAKFCSSVSELYSHTFKPTLDVIFFARSLANTIGYKGQFIFYGYFIFSSIILRAISPPLALLTAQESALSGDFRNAHQRIVANAEEIAFNDPPGGETECVILNDYLNKLIRHSHLSAVQRFLQQIADGYAVKYMATVVGFCVFAAPFFFGNEPDSKLSTGQYVRSIRLLTNSSNAISQLILVYKRVSTLAGYTSRVSELLESVQYLSENEEAFQAKFAPKLPQNEICHEGSHDLLPQCPCIIIGKIIKFDRITIYAPDGTLLVRELSFEVLPNNSVIIVGPNGSGKSSLLRVLAELWPLYNGTITKPSIGEIFYLSQSPYLVRGSLRDEVCYPKIPKDLKNTSIISQRSIKESETVSCRSSFDDDHVMQALEATGIAYLVSRGGLDEVQNWDEMLSGGEKQRLAVSRLLYHSPKFAVLDECTSAVSVDGEETLYRSMHEAGITLLSVAHRPSVKKFHSACLHIYGAQTGCGWKFEKINPEDTS